jgi:hypothetical protein
VCRRLHGNDGCIRRPPHASKRRGAARAQEQSIEYVDLSPRPMIRLTPSAPKPRIAGRALRRLLLTGCALTEGPQCLKRGHRGFPFPLSRRLCLTARLRRAECATPPFSSTSFTLLAREFQDGILEAVEERRWRSSNPSVGMAPRRAYRPNLTKVRVSLSNVLRRCPSLTSATSPLGYRDWQYTILDQGCSTHSRTHSFL